MNKKLAIKITTSLVGSSLVYIGGYIMGETKGFNKGRLYERLAFSEAVKEIIINKAKKED